MMLYYNTIKSKSHGIRGILPRIFPFQLSDFERVTGPLWWQLSLLLDKVKNRVSGAVQIKKDQGHNGSTGACVTGKPQAQQVVVITAPKGCLLLDKLY